MVIHLIYTSFQLTFLVHQPAHLTVHGCLLLEFIRCGQTSAIVGEALRVETTVDVGVVDATVWEGGGNCEIKVMVQDVSYLLVVEV